MCRASIYFNIFYFNDHEYISKLSLQAIKLKVASSKKKREFSDCYLSFTVGHCDFPQKLKYKINHVMDGWWTFFVSTKHDQRNEEFSAALKFSIICVHSILFPIAA